MLLAAYSLMLRAYSHQNDLVIGTPVANRHYGQIENLIGFFVNSLALRVQIDPQESLQKFIQKIGEEVVGAQLHQDLPFEKLVEDLKVAQDTSRHPIFQVMFAVQSFGSGAHHSDQDQKEGTRLLSPYASATHADTVAKFDLSTFIDDSQPQLRGNFNFAVSLYNESTINQFISTYIQILRQMVQLD